jgi:hypothetical protein
MWLERLTLTNIKRLEGFERLELFGVTPIDWTVKGSNLEHRSREFLG